VLIPYVAADQACYAFRVAEYAKHIPASRWTRGAQARQKPEGTYITELFSDDVAAVKIPLSLVGATAVSAEARGAPARASADSLAWAYSAPSGLRITPAEALSSAVVHDTGRAPDRQPCPSGPPRSPRAYLEKLCMAALLVRRNRPFARIAGSYQATL